MRTLLAASLLLGAISTGAAAAPPGMKPACDRTCLESYVDKYLDAMLAHKVDPALFARDAKFTENGVRLPLGDEGLWFGMSGKGTYKFYVPDVETQQVAFIGTVLENAQARAAANRAAAGAAPAAANPNAPAPKDTTLAIALRLKIVNGQITEIEQLAIRPETNLFGGGGASGGAAPRFPPTGEAVQKMGAPNPTFAEVIPRAKRASREELIETANYYFTGLARNDGKGYYPFTDDCVRYENGIETTHECKKQFENNLKGVVSRIRDRRFVAVDRERGIVFAFGFFDHEQINWTWQIAELFKVENGKIRRIEAVFQRAPYGTPSGWSSYEQAMSESIQSVR
jgi:hypothetical protein